VAAEALPRFRHGAWVVELAQIREPGVVDEAVVHGAVDALVPGMRDWGMFGVMREQTDVEIAAALTADTIEQLHARGAAMTLDEAESPVAALIERELPPG